MGVPFVCSRCRWDLKLGYFTSLLDTLHGIDAVRQINALKPSFHMIATIAAIVLRLYENRTLKRDDRCDCCDCNRRDRKIAISTIVAIVKFTTLRSLQSFGIARITTVVVLPSLRSSVAGLRSVQHEQHNYFLWFNQWQNCMCGVIVVFTVVNT